MGDCTRERERDGPHTRCVDDIKFNDEYYINDLCGSARDRGAWGKRSKTIANRRARNVVMYIYKVITN